jgi:hypothetical protein
VRIDNEQEATDEVLGRKDTDGNGTYANMLGNTKVQMDGGSWIWNRKADIHGNITTWTSADADSKRVCSNIEEFKHLVFTLVAAASLDSITDAATKEVISRIRNDKNTSLFFDLDRRSFINNHNTKASRTVGNATYVFASAKSVNDFFCNFCIVHLAKISL